MGGVAEARPEQSILPSLPSGLLSQLEIYKKREIFTTVRGGRQFSSFEGRLLWTVC